MNKVDFVKSTIIGPNQSPNPAHYSDDFVSTDAVGSAPMDKTTWLSMTPLMQASFPDIEYVVEDIREEGGRVSLTGHFVGTFTRDLDLSAMGMGVIRASGKLVTWPTSHNLITVEGGQITKWESTDTGPDAGISGFLKVVTTG